MQYNLHQSFWVTDRSFAHTIKKDIHKLAESFGFSASRLGKLDIIVSELISNLLKHTTSGGELLVKSLPGESDKAAGIEIISIDSGPGMRDPQRMLEDGVSTAGSRGEGLGAIKRLADVFDVFSQVDSGTVILVRLYTSEAARPKPTPNAFHTGAVMVAKLGETFCGDNGAVMKQGSRYAIATIDGLGHGEEAAIASQEAVSVFMQLAKESPSQVLLAIHEAIRKTRGAVGAITAIDLKKNQVSFCGIGNIAGKVYTGESVKSLISYNGMLGNNRPHAMNDHNIPWEDSSLLILHSDGLKSRWDLSKYNGLKKCDPSVIAAVLYKDFSRKTDDILVIVGKHKR